MQRDRYRRALVALLAALPCAAIAQGSMSLSWTPPTTNTDGSALTNLAGYRVYWGSAQGNYPNSTTLANPAPTSYVIDGLTPATWHSVVTAFNTAGVESAFSNVASKVIAGAPLELPGPVRNLVVTPLPPVAAGVVVSSTDANSGEFDLAIEGSGPVTVSLLGGEFDWCKPGGLSGNTATPTVPALGVTNNDGVRFKTVTFTAPIVRTRCDADNVSSTSQAFVGANVTVQGVTKALVQSGSSWLVQFRF